MTNQNFLHKFAVKVFIFMAGIVTVISSVIILYIFCKQSKLKTLVTSLALHQIKPVMSQSLKTDEIICVCKINWTAITILCMITILFLTYIIRKARKLKLFYADHYVNTSGLYLFFSNLQYYVPVKLCTVNGTILNIKSTGKLEIENALLKKNILWDILEIDWKDVKVYLKNKAYNLPVSITISLKDKFRLGRIMKKKELSVHLMLKQGLNWYMIKLENKNELPDV